MPVIQLPNSKSAVIISKDDITERQSRAISRSYIRAAGVAAKLANLGFDDANPTTWGAYAELSDEEVGLLTEYQATLIVEMVKSWDFDKPVSLEAALDLPKAVFDKLSDACGLEFNGSSVNTEPHIDPKAPTAD